MKTMRELGYELGVENVKTVKVVEDNLDAIGNGIEAVLRIKRAYVSYIKYTVKESFSIQNNISFIRESIYRGPVTAMKDILIGSIKATMEGMVSKETHNG